MNGSLSHRGDHYVIIVKYLSDEIAMFYEDNPKNPRDIHSHLYTQDFDKAFRFTKEVAAALAAGDKHLVILRVDDVSILETRRVLIYKDDKSKITKLSQENRIKVLNK